MDWFPFFLSMRVALVATLVATVLGVTAGWVFARHDFPGRRWLEAILTVPIVLPPTVLGYYLLVTIGRQSKIGRAWESVFGEPIVFTWKAAAVASTVAAFPFVLRTSRAAIAEIDVRFEHAARTMGFPEWRIALQITLPLARLGIFAGIALGFARALGEFGATVMIAGNIPGRTQTMPVAIYSQVEAGNQHAAMIMSLILTGMAIVALIAVGRFEKRPA